MHIGESKAIGLESMFIDILPTRQDRLSGSNEGGINAREGGGMVSMVKDNPKCCFCSSSSPCC